MNWQDGRNLHQRTFLRGQETAPRALGLDAHLACIQLDDHSTFQVDARIQRRSMTTHGAR
jgi:hypothetical protein